MLGQAPSPTRGMAASWDWKGQVQNSGTVGAGEAVDVLKRDAESPPEVLKIQLLRP